ncbi:MAG TPA: DMT family transporter [Verrucomicrobiae bacterium]|nr:DMT family transporter [Verrucomicrobiae bacterium]
MKLSYLIILLVMNFFWAAVYSAYKIIGQTLPTGAIVTLRFGVAGLCLLFAWPWLPGQAPRGRDLAVSCVMGLVLFVVGQRLQVFGNSLGRAGDSAVLMAFEPIITSLLAGIFLREHIGPRRWAGFALGLSGVALLHGVWRTDFRWAGLGASSIFISSFICEAAYSVMGKTILARAGVMKMLAITLWVGTLANLALDGGRTFAAAGELPFQGWVLVLGLAIICTAIGYSLWFMVIRECPVNVAALTVFAQSVFGVALAAFWLHEPLRWGQFWGCLVIVAGLVLGLSRQIQPSVAGQLSQK